MNLNVSDWKTFYIGRLFTMLNGKGITQEEITDNQGCFTAVQSGEENNGVMGKIDINYCKQMKYTYTEKSCLTVARSGSAGFVSYQHVLHRFHTCAFAYGKRPFSSAQAGASFRYTVF